MALPQLIEGTWEEILTHKKALEGRKVKVFVQPIEEEYTLEAALTKLNNRTPEEIASARQRILNAASVPQSLPEGKTLNDVILGQWPGDESDEEINALLEKLS